MNPKRLPPHSKDLRKGRVSERGRAYHLRASLADNRPLFTDFQLGREVVQAMRALHERGEVESLAFVVMPTHLHWLVVLTADRGLDEVMQSLKGAAARRINQRLGRTGVLWQDGYFDHALRRDEDLRAVARYIVGNPLRAGLVQHLGDYPLWDAKWL
ncbi:transposase [uncultured Thiodictyon sp.]|uniref:REP-associated tyrosine transposase n=1 Tax=uncultured Thiodictyon sp. TaxID=1846217 RepID=UPI0025D76264|nr:transposase [uncultured Thiodictyon sp.]